MAENGSLASPSSDKINRKPTSFPRLFTGLTTLKGFAETEVSVMSPTSILDISKPFSILKNPFWSELTNNIQHSPKTPEPETRHKLESKGGIGCLGIVDVLKDEIQDPNKPKTETRMVLFGSQLKIQIPPLVSSVLSPQDSPKSPAEFGIKTRNQLGSSFSSVTPSNSPQVFTGCLSATEMELSEDYTCVISHGPNPKTTHIFDNCIVESCCGVAGFSSLRKESNEFMSKSDDRFSYPSESFLSFCYNCRKNLGPGKDIYMYRGEKAFCSQECRFQEMMLEEEGMDKLDPDDVYST
ncbi:hypothetical protein AB3S75_044409 [Citrus x aurantiifolia]